MTVGEIDKLGKRIGKSFDGVSDSDMDLLQEYRKTFKEPIAEVYNFLYKSACKIDSQSIVTYRIKRIDTIIRKLGRFTGTNMGDMRLSRMWDIAGCRCILKSPDDDKLYKLLYQIKSEYGNDCKINDYVKNPKGSGYRSIHIYVKDKKYNKPVEIQIRNRIHHNWSTLVEIIDVIFEVKTKEGEKAKGLDEFLLLYSIKDKLTKTQLKTMINFERKNRIFEKLSSVFSKNYIDVYKKWVQDKPRGSFYVIEANSKGSSIEAFNTFEDAENDYYEKYIKNKDKNIVLTHITYADFDKLSVAYSNYILSMHAFFDEYRELIGKNIIEYIHKKDFWILVLLFRVYKRYMSCYIDNIRTEIEAINSCMKTEKSNFSQLNKWKKSVKDRLKSWSGNVESFVNSVVNIPEEGSFYRFYVTRKIKGLLKK